MAFGKSSTYTLYTEYFDKKFVTNICSWGFIFNVFVILTVIILPFVLTFSTGTFWAKHDVYIEQPTVTFKNKMFAQFMFQDLSTNVSEVYSYSNVKPIRDQTQNLINPPSIKSSYQDFDRDGIPERWNISMRVRKPSSSSTLSSLQLLFAFDYQTTDVITMQMESLAIISVDIPIASTNQVRSIKTIGDLNLKQTYPVRVKRDIRTLYNDNLFTALEHESIEAFKKRYTTSRNETTEYQYETYIQRGTADQTYIDISVVINIPVYQEIVYIPDVWEVLKFAWISYYSLLLLIYVLLYHLFYGFVIKNKVFDSVEVDAVNVNTLRNN